MGKKKKPAPVPETPVVTTPVTPEPEITQTGPSGPTGPYNEVLSGYKNFAETGGFSAEDLANIRSRSLSPLRAIYKNAEADVDRQRALQGGYMPGYNVMKSRMAREQGTAANEAAINTEAGLAEQIRQGKLAGLSGLSGMIDYSPGGGGGRAKETPQPEEAAPVQEPPKKKGFWSKLGGALKKIGQVALPIALSPIPGGSIAGKVLGTGGLSKIGSSALSGMAQVPNVRPAKR